MENKSFQSASDDQIETMELIWRQTFFRWCLPVVLAIVCEHLIRTWGSGTAPIDGFALLIVASAWIGVILGLETVTRYAAYFVDAAILAAFLGGLGAVAAFSSQMGFGVLRELEFWAPVISVFWVTFHYRQPVLTAVFIVVFYCGIFWGDWASLLDHDTDAFLQHVFAYLAQVVLLVALMKLFSAFRRRETLLKEELDAAVDHALHDPLTALPNRRFFDEELMRGCERVNRDGCRLSIIIADVDHFKAFNDEYGHSCGDEVLKTVARIISERIRVSDCACRWGGEEFAIILHNTDLANASELAEELRAAFASQLVHDSKRLTISFGVSEYHAGESPHAAFDRADRALFRAKSLGRNRVEIDRGFSVPALTGK